MDKWDESAAKAWAAILTKVRALDEGGETLEGIAKLLGIKNRGSISLWLSGGRKAENTSFPNMLRYLERLGLDYAEFLPSPAPTIQRLGTHSPAEVVQGDDLRSVPILMEAGAGPDIEVFSGDVGDTIPILPAYWRPDMWAVRIKGDSMEPLIMSGACVGVVPLEGDFIEGGLYLVRMPHFGYVVKRVRMGDDGLVLLSENPRIPPRHVPFEGHENIIVGRVVWFWQMCE